MVTRLLWHKFPGRNENPYAGGMREHARQRCQRRLQENVHAIDELTLQRNTGYCAEKTEFLRIRICEFRAFVEIRYLRNASSPTTAQEKVRYHANCRARIIATPKSLPNVYV